MAWSMMQRLRAAFSFNRHQPTPRNAEIPWTGIDIEQLTDMIAAGEQLMSPAALSLWKLIRVPPSKWQLHPWGDDIGGYWVVGLIGDHAIWFNDNEDGFNYSRYSAYGTIDEFWCNQDDLQDTMHVLIHHLTTGAPIGRFGLPQPMSPPKAE